jgi:iron(III) transport system ATP-binding protein
VSRPSPRVAAAVLTHVTKSFGTHQILRNLNLTVPAQQITAVLGPSGCGKTTLLRILAGFETVDAGTVTLAGKQVDGPSAFVAARSRGIGYVPQDASLFPHLSVAANIGFGVARAKRGRQVERMISLVGLDGLGRRRPDELSGGQRQRVALARALAIGPQLVLLDEPFSALDPGLRTALRAEVVDLLRRTRTTAVLVTHDQDEALSTADHLAILHGGQVAQAGLPEHLWACPASERVASFLGSGTLLEAVRQGQGRATCRFGLVPVSPPDGPTRQRGHVLLRADQVMVTPLSAGNAAKFPHATGRVVTSDFHGHQYLLAIQITPNASWKPDNVASVVQAGNRSQASPESGPDGPVLHARHGLLGAPAVGDTLGVTITGPVLFLPLPGHGDPLPGTARVL